ncbi:MAG TPA: monofunctional biosynthetic peptidoglycan transglycosylase [Chitinophagaceae bacterium]|nr:MAG: peptidoglycan transglycosylase [Bacteroidetes bacterium OLB11]HMN33730.1 monofunctional biosynthetic peptidoglycan transglycosylase [Chitinophagaceae bacterium]
MAKKKKQNSIWRTIKLFILFLFLSNLTYLVVCKWINPPITTIMIQSLIKGNGLKRTSISKAAMGKNIQLAVLSSEDQLFPNHNGFDFDAIQKAIQFNQKSDFKKIKGASTISQQTAKNVFLWNGRNWFRKGLEVYHTLLIEWIWGKKRILEVYLNIAEMGKGIFGIEAASQYYFKKRAIDLTKSEAAWIATILPNPIKYDLKNPSPQLTKKHLWILSQMNNLASDSDVNELISNQ